MQKNIPTLSRVMPTSGKTFDTVRRRKERQSGKKTDYELFQPLVSCLAMLLTHSILRALGLAPSATVRWFQGSQRLTLSRRVANLAMSLLAHRQPKRSPVASGMVWFKIKTHFIIY
jgi:hypothetical protein